MKSRVIIRKTVASRQNQKGSEGESNGKSRVAQTEPASPGSSPPLHRHRTKQHNRTRAELRRLDEPRTDWPPSLRERTPRERGSRNRRRWEEQGLLRGPRENPGGGTRSLDSDLWVGGRGRIGARELDPGAGCVTAKEKKRPRARGETEREGPSRFVS